MLNLESHPHLSSPTTGPLAVSTGRSSEPDWMAWRIIARIEIENILNKSSLQPPQLGVFSVGMSWKTLGVQQYELIVYLKFSYYLSQQQTHDSVRHWETMFNVCIVWENWYFKCNFSLSFLVIIFSFSNCRKVYISI